MTEVPPVGDVPLQYYGSDEDAIADGLQVGDWYLLNWGNNYGMAGDVPKKVSN
jgi:hypothetical protein